MQTEIIERKRVIQLDLSESALAEAEAAGLDIGRVVEEALRGQSRKIQAERWKLDNREAIAWHNALIEFARTK
jgi:post-segregation antitoxin (ccd killing protein)